MSFNAIGVYLVAVLILCDFIHREKYWWGLLDLILSFAVLHWLGFLDAHAIAAYVIANPTSMVAGAGAYLGIGVIYAFFRWARFVIPIAQKYKEAKAKFAKAWDIQVQWIPGQLGKAKPGPTGNKAKERNIDLTHEWARVRPREVDEDGGKGTVPIANHKARVTGWLAWWPVSALAWALGDFLVQVFEAIYDQIKGFFQNYADRQFK